MVFALVLPWFWGAILIALGAAWWARRRSGAQSTRGGVSPALLIPFVFPVAIIFWAALLYASLQGKRFGWYWQDLGVLAILGLQALSVALLFVRNRGRLSLALVTSLVAIWWAAGASFVAGMAVHNDWL